MVIEVRVRGSPNEKKRRVRWTRHGEYGHRDARAPRIPYLHAHGALADVTVYTFLATVHIFSHLGAAVGDEDDD